MAVGFTLVARSLTAQPVGVIPEGGFNCPSGSRITIVLNNEDDDNANSLTGDTEGSDVFLTVGRNTLLRMVRVTTCG